MEYGAWNVSMEYGDLIAHEADAFELDHVITYKQSSKFNSWNVLMEVNLISYMLYANNRYYMYFIAAKCINS